MERTVFLGIPQFARKIRIICWNINRVCTKLEKTDVFEILTDYDVIALSETKTCLPVRLPGYVSYRGKSLGSDERGGMVVLVKNYLSDFVCDFDGSIGDQVWLLGSVTSLQVSPSTIPMMHSLQCMKRSGRGK